MSKSEKTGVERSIRIIRAKRAVIDAARGLLGCNCGPVTPCPRCIVRERVSRLDVLLNENSPYLKSED